MILKIFFLIFTLLLITASDPYFGITLGPKPPLKEIEKNIRDLPWQRTDAFDAYLEDYDDRVNDAFQIKSYYSHMVRFWFFIYTQFSSSQVVFHDKNDMTLIYRVLDFSYLHAKKLPANTLYVLQRKITEEKRDEMVKLFRRLASDPYSLKREAKDMYDTILRAGVKIPVEKKKRIAFFHSLADNLRTQTGQKNFIKDGIMRSLPYQKFLKSYFNAKGLPPEITSIPFLESSFNPAAQSKVDALGAWQFMPLIASYFTPKRTNLHDYRFNVGVSSVAAAFLMSENFRILKRWDLSVTAYNSGTKHLVSMKRILKNPSADLEEIIRASDSRHFGFASKNFYSEFLALAHTLAYREELFDSLHDHERSDVDEMLRFYLTKCSVKLSKFLNDKQLDDIEFHNHQISDVKKELPRGFILTSKSELPSNKFRRIQLQEMLKTKPLDWDRYIKGESCR